MQEDALRSCFREFLLLMRVNNVAGGKRIILGNPDVEKAVDNIYAARPQMHVARKGRELFDLIRTYWPRLLGAGGEPSLWSIQRTLVSKKYVDLTHEFAPGIPHWPGFPDETRKTI